MEGGDPPKTPSPPPHIGKNEIYNRENLVRPFLVHQVSGSRFLIVLKKPWRGGVQHPKLKFSFSKFYFFPLQNRWGGGVVQRGVTPPPMVVSRSNRSLLRPLSFQCISQGACHGAHGRSNALQTSPAMVPSRACQGHPEIDPNGCFSGRPTTANPFVLCAACCIPSRP